MTPAGTRYSRNYRKKYPERHREQSRSNLARMRIEHPERLLFTWAKCRAKRRGIPFSISLEDIDIPALCPKLGVPLRFLTKYAPSLDRIDNSKGYEPGNVWVISLMANRMKNEATREELQAFSRSIDL